MSQAALAAAVGVDSSTIERWERGTQQPSREKHCKHLAAALQWTLDELSALLAGDGHQPSSLLLASPLPGAAHPLGAGDVDSLRHHIRLLIDIDNQYGGDAASAMAVQLFRSVNRKLGIGHFDPRYESDLYALTGELGEVAGWLLYDANQQGLMRAVNMEARHLLQLAGDRSMELLVLQNMSMQADHLGRSSEAMRIARMVLESGEKHSPRIQALFHIRTARALAQAGDGFLAMDTYDKARALYGDGAKDSDPPWAWWFNDLELSFHKSMIFAAAGEWHKATELVEQSFELLAGEGLRRIYLRHAHLLGMQVRVGAWTEAVKTMENIVPYIGEVGSGRTVLHIASVLRWLKSRKTPAAVQESAKHLQDVLVAAGYAVD